MKPQVRGHIKDLAVGKRADSQQKRIYDYQKKGAASRFTKIGG